MKRIAAILILFCMLFGCQPTPEKEFVVNKGDNTVQQRLDATPNPAEAEPAALPFPDRWEEEESLLSGGVRLAVDAEIIQKSDGRYPVFRTRSVPFTAEDVAKDLSVLLGNPVESYQWVQTKAYWEAIFRRYLDEVERRRAWTPEDIPKVGDVYVPTDDEVEERTNVYMEYLLNAPDDYDRHAASDFSGLSFPGRTCYTLENGEQIQVSCYPQLWALYRKYTEGYAFTTVQTSYMHDENMASDDTEEWVYSWQEPTMRREEAEAILHREMERLGYTDFTVNAAFPANYIGFGPTEDIYCLISTGWSFRLRRNYANYPVYNTVLLPSDLFNLGDDAEDYRERVADERIDVYIDADGLQSFEYTGKKEILGITNPNVDLMPFDELKEQVKTTLGACLAGSRLRERHDRFEIYRMLLTTYTLWEKNTENYLELPCWLVFVDYPLRNEAYREQRRNDPTGDYQNCLILNAIDGSIIDPQKGY